MNHQGNMQGSMNMPGNMAGMQGNMGGGQGNIPSNMQGSIQNNMTGISGNMGQNTQGGMHFSLQNNFSPSHIPQQNLQSQHHNILHTMPQQSAMGQQMSQQMPQQIMQQQIIQQQQMIAQQQNQQLQQIPQIQQQMNQQQGMIPQQNVIQQMVPQQQVNQQINQQQAMFQHPQQHSPMPQQMMQPQQMLQQQQQQQQLSSLQQLQVQQQQQQQQQQKDFNPASWCRLGQEAVQELVSRVQECLQILKNLQPPIGTPQSTTQAMEKKNKLDEQLKNVKILFKRLRIVYNKCIENTQDLEGYAVDSLLPSQTNIADWKYDDRKQTEQYIATLEERKELYEQIAIKNRHLQEITDYMRTVIWDINTMLMMKKQ